MRQILWPAIVAVLLSPARADTTAAAVRELDLFGTWSVDCASPTEFRVILAESADGGIVHTSVSVDEGRRTTVHAKAISVNPAGYHRLTLRLRITGGDIDGGPLPSPTTNTLDETIERLDAHHIRLLNIPPMTLERCREK